MADEITTCVINEFKGRRNDIGLPTLDKSYLNTATNCILYRGRILKVPGYRTYLSAVTDSSAIQLITPFQIFGGAVATNRLVLATEKTIWALNSGGTAWQNISRITTDGTQVTNYGGDKDNVWSAVGYLENLYLTNYAYSTPQVWNGTLSDGSPTTINAGELTYASNFCTVAHASHGLTSGQVIEMRHTGTTNDANYWGSFQVIRVDDNSFKYQPVSTPASSPATDTGTMTYRITSKCGNAIVPNRAFKAKIVRTFENHLMYMNVFDGTYHQPFTIYYSDIGTPVTWNSTTLADGATSSGDAGFTARPDDNQFIVVGGQIGSYFVIYKTGMAILLSYVGDELKWEFQPSVTVGAYSSKSTIIYHDEHYLLARDANRLFDSVRTYNGQSSDEIASSLGVRDNLRDSFTDTFPETVIGAYWSEKDCLIWLYPSASSSTYPDRAIVYNIKDDTWFTWELNATGYITSLGEFLVSNSILWDSLDDFISAGATLMDSLPYAMDSSAYSGKQRLFLLGDSAGQVYKMDGATGTFNSTAITTTVGRTDFRLDSDEDLMKYVNRVELVFKDTGQETILYFSLSSRLKGGSSAVIGGDTKTITLIPGQTSYKIDLFQVGKLFSWSLYSNDTTLPFELQEIIIYYWTGGRE